MQRYICKSLVALAVTGLLCAGAGCSSAEGKSVGYKVQLPDGQGITTESRVQMRGADIGTVSKVTLDEQGVLVAVKVGKENTKFIRTSTRALVSDTTPVNIILTEPDTNAKVLKAGGVIPSASAEELGGQLGQELRQAAEGFGNMLRGIAEGIEKGDQ